MRIGYLHCFSGISGDMFLGALVDAGVPPDLFRSTINSLGLRAELKVRRVEHSGIAATRVDVIVEQESQHQPDQRPHSRYIADIRRLIERAALEGNACTIALRAFELLGEVEARIHNRPLEEIHFHEVGAVDSIVDIVCTAVGAGDLGVQRWVCSPLNVGGGTVECAHGTFPVPAPATLELLRGAPTYSSGVEAELVTPTGAALLRALQAEFGAFPAMRSEKSGYGAGSRELPGMANVLRLTIGEAVIDSFASPASETVAVLETAVDDTNPQLIGYVIERALAEGALDAISLPVQMKKSRPGNLLTILCRPEDAVRMRDLLLRETTTLGVRMRTEQRACLERKLVTVKTRWGEVRIKLGLLDRTTINCAPEFEDCRRLAEASGVAVKEVMQEALRAYLETTARGGSPE